MKNKNLLYVGGLLLALFVLYKLASGFIWFLIQTAVYGVLLLIVLSYLKKKGFFNP